MPRTRTPQIECSPECTAAIDRVTALARQLALMLIGETPSADGSVSPLAAAMAMGMMYFLLRIDPTDQQVLFCAEGSLADVPLKPLAAGFTRRAPLAELFGGGPTNSRSGTAHARAAK